MAAARNGSKSTKSGRDSSRLSFAKITDTLKVPDLLDLQTESFAWLVGNEEWQQRVAQGEANQQLQYDRRHCPAGQPARQKSGDQQPDHQDQQRGKQGGNAQL